jgi:diguanylate cyclase (GGDEF)-like protein
LRQSDQFDRITEFLSRRRVLRSARQIMAVVAGSSALVPVTFLITVRRPTAGACVIGAVAAAFTIGMTVFWLTRWPTRRQSEVSVTAGTVLIAVWSLSQPTATGAVLTSMAAAVTGGYIAFFHSSRLLLFNFAAALIMAVSGSLRVARDSDLGTAAAAFWLIWFINLSVPLSIRGMSRAMGSYAMRSEADPLTSLLNRRAFTDAISRQLTDSAGDMDLTLLMVDLDDFKRVNDTHGHPAGDRALLAVADLLRRHSPPTAEICRAGGEEFLIAMIGARQFDVQPMTARLCAAIAELPHDITASIGTSSAALNPETGLASTIEQLIAAADRAMYSAKRNGGNRVQHA